MRYVMFMKHTEEYPPADVLASLDEAVNKFIEEATKNGNIVTAAGLQPSSAGARVRLSGKKVMITDGPFVETKELVGGYAIMDAKTREEALGLALRFVEVHLEHWPTLEGECEVRPLEEAQRPA